MNITRENIDNLNAVLKVHIEKNDYQEKVEKVLRDYRKKANIKGFRPGMVPIDLIRKMYGLAVKVDEINKSVSESIHKYITDEKIDILGDPLPKTDEQEKFDFEKQDDFNFSFEMGLAPAFEVNSGKKDKVTSYEIIIDEKMRNDFVANYTRRYGEFKKEEATGEKDILKGKIEAVDEKGNQVPEGLFNENSTLAVDIIKDEEIKKNFIGKKENDSIDFDIRKAFPNEIEIAGLLGKKKEETEGLEGIFRFTIREITRFYSAEINQELFNRIYGENIVNSEEEFMKKSVSGKKGDRRPIEVSRFKGLGEMPARQLKETTMDPKTRVLMQVRVPLKNDPTQYMEWKETAERVEALMGKRPELRFQFIQEHAPSLSGENLDI